MMSPSLSTTLAVRGLSTSIVAVITG